MEINVEEVIENADGSATLRLDMDSEATAALLSMAIIDAIKNGIEMHKNQTEDYVDSLQLELDL